MIREARPDDVADVLRLIRALADYEREPAAVEATEEAVLNALWAAPDVTGREGRVVRGLPHDEVLELLRERHALA